MKFKLLNCTLIIGLAFLSINTSTLAHANDLDRDVEYILKNFRSKLYENNRKRFGGCVFNELTPKEFMLRCPHGALKISMSKKEYLKCQGLKVINNKKYIKGFESQLRCTLKVEDRYRLFSDESSTRKPKKNSNSVRPANY